LGEWARVVKRTSNILGVRVTKGSIITVLLARGKPNSRLGRPPTDT
jgi:hypothetical protein